MFYNVCCDTMKLLRAVLLMILLFGTLSGANAISLSSVKTKTLPVNFGDSQTTTYSNFTSLHPKLPDIGTYIKNNVSQFSSDGFSDYSGNDVVSQLSETFYNVTVSLTKVELLGSDKDTIGAGDVFIEGYTNGNKSRYPTAGNEWQINDNGNVVVSVQLVTTIAYSYNISYELRESDPGSPDQSFGFVIYTPTTIVNETKILTTDAVTDGAKLTFDITAKKVHTSMTAKEILDGNRPYLHVDDETSQTELPDDLVGRVIIGDDNGINAMVLQYFFFWNAEYSPDGGIYSVKLHQNDFEAFYVYYDLDNFGEPYRMVFNNYIYTDLPGFPNENLLILQKGATAGDSNYTNDISNNLQLLLVQLPYRKPKHYQ